ncbi:glycoside hydrolase superfamily [Dissophora ornata]|nr:glycoside hydrolase superfamily [Dissophora ornata]
MDKATTKAAAHTVVTDPALVNEKSPWLRQETKKQKQVRTCICLGVILCFLVLGTILAFTFREQIFRLGGGQQPASQRKSPVVQSIEDFYHVNKTITKDPSLVNIFYGIDYTPMGSQEPGCKVNLGNVIEDIKVLSQLTNRIRLYGMACQQTEAVLKAIEYLELPNMQVVLTLWVDSSPQSWLKQSQIFWNLIDNELKMDTSSVISRIMGISVGNEVLFRNEDLNYPAGFVPVSTLTGYIDEIRQGLAERFIPVFSSDLGRNAHQIVNQVDWVMSNIHPFFANTVATTATSWAIANFKNETLGAAAGKPAAISEIGWPSGPSSASQGLSVPSMDNLQTFLDSWVCLANKSNIPYFYFEAFDEPWKNSINAREAQWGIMTVDRTLKVTLPRCT